MHRLEQWLMANGISRDDFARLIDVEHATVTRYINGDRVPRPKIMARIVEKTGGQITANDFMLHAPVADAVNVASDEPIVGAAAPV